MAGLFNPVNNANEIYGVLDVNYYTISEELIFNGGFETWESSGPTGWITEKTAGAITQETTIKHRDSSSVKIVTNSVSSYSPSLTNTTPITVIPGVTYELSVWVMGDGTNSLRYGVYNVSNSSYITSLNTSIGVTAAEWTKTTKLFTIPTGCTQIRIYLRGEPIVGAVGYVDSVSLKQVKTQINKNGVLTPIQEILDLVVKNTYNPFPRIILPDEFISVVGDELQLFIRGIIEAQNPYNLPYTVECSIGNAYPRYYTVTPLVSDVGTKTLTVTITNHDGISLATESCNLVIVNPAGQPSANINVLCVGDSLTAGLEWPQEAYRRLTQAAGSPAGLEYGNISFIGTQAFPNFSTQKAVGNGGWSWDTYRGISGSGVWVNNNPDNKDSTDQHSIYVDTNAHQWVLETIEAGQIKVTGYGGATYTMPATGTLTWVSGGTHYGTITYTTVIAEAATPFWDETEDAFSFSAFCDDNGYSGIDVMYVLLGWNDLLMPNKKFASDHATNIAKARAFIDQLHTDYPSALVRVLGLEVPSPTGGLGTNYGAVINMTYYQLLRSVNGWNLALQDMVNESAYSSFCKYINVAAQFDSEYNLPCSSVAVNARSATTESRGTNGVHPIAGGYYQIADAVFRDFIRTYCCS